MFYVGLGEQGLRERFAADVEPTADSHPHYLAVIGPYQTVEGADYSVKYGAGNPHCQSVADAEFLAHPFSGKTDVEYIKDCYVGQLCWLNDRRAKITGRANRFATISPLDPAFGSVEFNWRSVPRIMERGGFFEG